MQSRSNIQSDLAHARDDREGTTDGGGRTREAREESVSCRVDLSSAVAADLRGFYTGLVFDTSIPRNVRLAEAPSYGKPVLYYDERSRGTESYLQLAKEMLTNDEETAGQGPERLALDRLAASG